MIWLEYLSSRLNYLRSKLIYLEKMQPTYLCHKDFKSPIFIIIEMKRSSSQMKIIFHTHTSIFQPHNLGIFQPKKIESPILCKKIKYITSIQSWCNKPHEWEDILHPLSSLICVLVQFWQRPVRLLFYVKKCLERYRSLHPLPLLT